MIHWSIKLDIFESAQEVIVKAAVTWWEVIYTSSCIHFWHYQNIHNFISNVATSTRITATHPMVLITLHLLRIIFRPAVTDPLHQSLFQLHHLCLYPHVIIAIATFSMMHSHHHLWKHDTCSAVVAIISVTQQTTISIAPHLHPFIQSNKNSHLYNIAPPTLYPSEKHLYYLQFPHDIAISIFNKPHIRYCFHNNPNIPISTIVPLSQYIFKTHTPDI